MTQRPVSCCARFIPVIAVLLGTAALAQSARDAIRPGGRSSSPASTRAAAKQVLPDPALLDGAKHPPEKRPEQGMLGEFEMPGDENARTGQVGGGSQQPGQEQSQQQGQGGGGQMAQAQPEQPGGGGAEPAQAPQQQGGAQPGGQQAGGAQGDPNAKAEGIQVAQLQGEGGGNPGDMAGGQKPSQVSIGDAAMQIQTMPNSPSVVGTQSSGTTQQHEKTTGTGGKAPVGNNANKGAERGRTMPAGL